ncbi:MAG: GNAT family N-acetyltransferase [Clostridia bacterium]
MWLETDRLILRHVNSDDADDVFRCWMQDEDVSRYMLWKASNDINKAREFIDFEMNNLENEKWHRWIIVLKDTEDVIGTCLIFFNEEENNWDISYNLGKRFWGMGYMTEAMSRVMMYAEEELKIKECIAAHAAKNKASGRVLQKLGFRLERKAPYKCGDGTVTEGLYYRLKF